MIEIGVKIRNLGDGSSQRSDAAAMTFRAFVFDLDGTLVDSKIDFQSMKAELHLEREADVLLHIETLHSVERAKALETVYRHELAGAKTSVAILGALEFVQRVRAANRPCAIFTRNARSLAADCLRDHGFEVDCIVAREDAPPKPKPDGLFKIAQSFGVRPQELLFVGDYLYDLQAGLASGVPTALYLPSPPGFDTDGAHFIFEKYQQLTDRIFPD